MGLQAAFAGKFCGTSPAQMPQDLPPPGPGSTIAFTGRPGGALSVAGSHGLTTVVEQMIK